MPAATFSWSDAISLLHFFSLVIHKGDLFLREKTPQFGIASDQVADLLPANAVDPDIGPHIDGCVDELRPHRVVQDAAERRLNLQSLRFERRLGLQVDRSGRKRA